MDTEPGGMWYLKVFSTVTLPAITWRYLDHPPVYLSSASPMPAIHCEQNIFLHLYFTLFYGVLSRLHIRSRIRVMLLTSMQ